MGRKELLGSETLLSPEGDNCTTVKCEEILGAQPSIFGKWCAQLLLLGFGVGEKVSMFQLDTVHPGIQTCPDIFGGLGQNCREYLVYFLPSFLCMRDKDTCGWLTLFGLLQYIRVKGRKGTIFNTEELFSLRLSHETKVPWAQNCVLWRRALGLRCLLTHVGGTGQSRASQISQCG